jgi:hypothetical protein
MFAWLVEMCIVTARRGSPYEADLVAKVMHKFYPEKFRNWRGVEEMQRDVTVGVWLGWFGWFAFPSLFPQGISAALLSGISGIFFGVLGLIFIIILGGAVVLLLRTVGTFGGWITLMVGELGTEDYTRFVGWCILPVAIWATANAIISMMNIGVI